MWSFANNGKDYIFSKELEPIKKAFHYVIIFNNWRHFDELYNYEYLTEILNGYGVNNPKVFLDLYKEKYIQGLGRQEHLRTINWIQKNYLNVRYSFAELQQLEQLRQLERLQQLERLEQTFLDYREVKILPHSVIYCDIPYKISNSIDYLKEEFDHKAFWEWAEKQTQAVFVSEYNYWGDNPDKWKVIYEKEKISLRSTTDGKRWKNIEKVFWNKKEPS